MYPTYTANTVKAKVWECVSVRESCLWIHPDPLENDTDYLNQQALEVYKNIKILNSVVLVYFKKGLVIISTRIKLITITLLVKRVVTC